MAIFIAHVRPGIQESAYVLPGIIDDIIRKLDGQVANSVNVLNNVLESEDIGPKMLSFDTFQTLTEDSTEIKQNWENMHPINLDEFKCQVRCAFVITIQYYHLYCFVIPVF